MKTHPHIPILKRKAIGKVFRAIKDTKLFSDLDLDKEDPFPYFALMNYFVRPAKCRQGMRRSYGIKEIREHDV